MNLLKRLLVVVIAMGVMGSIRAQMVYQVPNPGTPAADTVSYVTSALAIGYSFADIVNVQSELERRPLTDGTFKRAPDRSPAELSNVNDAAIPRSAGATATGTLLSAASALDDPADHLSAVAVPDDASAPRSGTAGRRTGAGFLFSIAEIPEPADWMTLLCGLVVMAFMARRKSGRFAD